MVSLKDIETAYENNDLLLDASKVQARVHGSDIGRNIAVDVSALTRLITLKNTKLIYNGEAVHVPGANYLISFKELEHTITERRAVIYGGRNIVPTLVEGIMSRRDANASLSLRAYREGERQHYQEWVKKGGLEELTAFAEISKARQTTNKTIDNKGAVLLGNLSPIILQVNYRRDNSAPIQNNYLARISLPLVIEAEEAEFTFNSEGGVKISDGDDNVGICKEGILEFEDLHLYVLGEADILRDK